MSHRCKDALHELGTQTGLGSTKPSKMPAWRACRHRGCTTENMRPACLTGRAYTRSMAPSLIHWHSVISNGIR